MSTMRPGNPTRWWRPVPVKWEGARLSEDGRSLFVFYVTGSPAPADRADLWWEQERLTLTLSRMFAGEIETAAAFPHCVEVPLSRDASDCVLVDGATGELSSEKKSFFLDPEVLWDTGQTLDSVFEPRERLEPREITT
jgi:hypothetical protein